MILHVYVHAPAYEYTTLLGPRDHKYLIYKAFRQKSEVFNSGSEFGIEYFSIQYCTSVKRLFLSKLIKKIFSRALLCIIRKI